MAPRVPSLLVGAVLLLGLAAGMARASNEEGDALYALRMRLSDPNGVLQSWDPTLVNPCTWFHVTCDHASRVVRLDLGNSNVSGSIGPEISRLVNLQYLELYRNNLNGEIPKELGKLKNLISLDLYANKLTGRIPKSLSKLSSLRFMRLNNNKLAGSIPGELAKLSNLKVMPHGVQADGGRAGMEAVPREEACGGSARGAPEYSQSGQGRRRGVQADVPQSNTQHGSEGRKARLAARLPAAGKQRYEYTL